MAETSLDIRQIPPRERHSRIFATFDQMAVGDSVLLANDHDPRPLYHQFNTERAGAFSWVYLEEGPGQWQVRINKTKANAPKDSCCGSCGG